MTKFMSVQGYTLRPYQREFITTVVSKYPHVATFDDMGLGKGHPVGTKVLTPMGWKNVETLEPGMMIVGSNGKPTKIIGVFDRGELPVYRVTMSDGSNVEVDGDHLWQVNTPVRKKRGGSPLVKSTTDLLIGGLRSGPNRKWFIPMVEPVQFDYNEYLSLDPWLLGVLIGDGSYSQNSVTITKANKDLFKLVEQVLPFNHSLKPIDNLTQRIVTSQPRNSVVAALKSLGIMGQLSYEKVIPKHYLRSSVENRLALLQGLLDTDSEITGSTIQHTTSSKQLAMQVRFLVQSLGGTAKIKPRTTFYTYKDERLEGKVNYRTTINLGGMQLFRSEEKLALYTAKTKYMPTRGIESIEYTREANVYCIAVEAHDKLYVTEDFIVTHNTAMCIAADAYRRQEAGPGPHKTLVVAPLTG
ncbi:MAG: ATP-dependent helicase, partial [Actinobacteria bacterium]|nr:ATP-dependent helicase [Actinomycetota bacterium]